MVVRSGLAAERHRRGRRDYRRASLARDLYDLAWFAKGGPLDEALIRRLTVLEVWYDVVDDALGSRPFDPSDVLQERDASSFREEDTGYLTTPYRYRGMGERCQEPVHVHR